MLWAIRANSSEELSMSERECHSVKSQNNPSRESGGLQVVTTHLDTRPDLKAFCKYMYVPSRVEIAREFKRYACFRGDNSVDGSADRSVLHPIVNASTSNRARAQ